MSDDPIRDLIREYSKKLREQTINEKLQSDFDKINKKALLKKSDEDLISWKSIYPPDSPHALFVDHVLKKRLQRQSFWYGTLTVIIGALIGFFLHDIIQKPTNDNPQNNPRPPISTIKPEVKKEVPNKPHISP